MHRLAKEILSQSFNIKEAQIQNLFQRNYLKFTGINVLVKIEKCILRNKIILNDASILNTNSLQTHVN